MHTLLTKLLRDERGVSALEYAILAGIIVVIVAGAVIGFGDNIGELFERGGEGLTAALEKSNETTLP